jgi:hypothetical protein
VFAFGLAEQQQYFLPSPFAAAAAAAAAAALATGAAADRSKGPSPSYERTDPNPPTLGSAELSRAPLPAFHAAPQEV